MTGIENAESRTVGPIESKQNRVEILESLRVLSPEGIAKLAEAARHLVDTDEGKA